MPCQIPTEYVNSETDACREMLAPQRTSTTITSGKMSVSGGALPRTAITWSLTFLGKALASRVWMLSASPGLTNG